MAHGDTGGTGMRAACPPPARDEGRPAGPLVRMWPHLNLLGVGAWWAWIWLCYNGTQVFSLLPEGLRTDAVATMYLSSTAGIAAVMVLAATLWRRVTVVVDSRAALLAVSAAAFAATLSLAPLRLYAGEAAFLACAALTGVCTSVLCLKSGRLYATLGLDDAMTAGGVALVFAALLYFAGSGLPGIAGAAFAALLPLAAAGLMLLGNGDPYPSLSTLPEAGSASVAGIGTVFRRLVAASAAIAFSSGVGKGLMGSLHDPAVYGLEGMATAALVCAMGAAIVAWVNARGAVRALKGVYTLLMVAGIALLMASCAGPVVPYIGVTKETLWLLFSCIMAYMAFRYDVSTVRLYGIGQAVYFVSTMAGWALGGLVAPAYGEQPVRLAVGVALAFMLVVALTYVFRTSDIDALAHHSTLVRGAGGVWSVERRGGRLVPPDGHAGGRAVPAGPSGSAGEGRTASAAGEGALDVALDAATAAAYGLSRREAEILTLFAQGRSANWIADALTISNNTVRSHLRAVYVKLGVHTRQELIDFLAAH